MPRNGSARTPAPVFRRNALLLLASIVVTFVALRVSLHLSPDSDFKVAGYNIHHLSRFGSRAPG